MCTIENTNVTFSSVTSQNDCGQHVFIARVARRVSRHHFVALFLNVEIGGRLQPLAFHVNGCAACLELILRFRHALVFFLFFVGRTGSSPGTVCVIFCVWRKCHQNTDANLLGRLSVTSRQVAKCSS